MGEIARQVHNVASRNEKGDAGDDLLTSLAGDFQESMAKDPVGRYRKRGPHSSSPTLTPMEHSWVAHQAHQEYRLPRAPSPVLSNGMVFCLAALLILSVVLLVFIVVQEYRDSVYRYSRAQRRKTGESYEEATTGIDCYLDDDTVGIADGDETSGLSLFKPASVSACAREEVGNKSVMGQSPNYVARSWSSPSLQDEGSWNNPGARVRQPSPASSGLQSRATVSGAEAADSTDAKSRARVRRS